MRKVRAVAGGGDFYSKVPREWIRALSGDYLVKLFISQIEILLNKHIESGFRLKINEQIDEQNSILLNDLLMQAYNQTEKRIHLIPSFKFISQTPNKTAVIDFRNGKVLMKYSELVGVNIRRICKLNNPFLQELRQRYLAYYGRIGVPKIPNILRNYNLKSLSPNT